MNPVDIDLEEVRLARGGRDLFAPVSASIAPGAFVAVRGANGMGKTSLLRALAGLLKPHAGRIGFARASEPLDREAARQSCLLLSHEDALKPQRTPRQEGCYWALALGGALDRVDAALERLGLAVQADLPCHRLSAGQRRRAALMRLLLTDRPIWLLDEPAANLDESGRDILAGLIVAQRARGGSVLAALHENWDAPDATLIALRAP